MIWWKSESRPVTISSANAKERIGLRSTRTSTLVAVGFVLEALALNLIQIPVSMRFRVFACADVGGNLVVEHFLSSGLKPEVDFGYHYGLLPLTVARIWFRLFGSTPVALQGALILCGLFVAIAMARVVVEFQVPWPGILLVSASMPIAAQASMSLAHGVEAALLSNAIATQPRSRATSLALATLACLTKPSMGYVYGFVLLIFWIIESRRNRQIGVAEFSRFVLPALATGTVTITFLAAEFGTASVVRTLLPLQGAIAYRQNGFGFFNGVGHRAIYFPGVHLAYYLGTYVGFWLLGTLWMIVISGWILWTHRTGVADEIILSCTILLTSFVLMFYGSAPSWTYYVFLMPIGMAVATSYQRANIAFATCVIALFALISAAVSTRDSTRAWLNESAERETSWLWATDDERNEWLEVERLARNGPAAFVSYAGAGSLLSPEFSPPTMLFLVPGNYLPSEIERERAQLASSNVITACSLGVDPLSWLTSYPELKSALEGTVVAFKTRDLVVLTRVASKH